MFTTQKADLQTKAEALIKKSDDKLDAISSQIQSKAEDVKSTFSKTVDDSHHHLTEFILSLKEMMSHLPKAEKEKTMIEKIEETASHLKQDTMGELEEILNTIKSTKQFVNQQPSNKKLVVALGVGMFLGYLLTDK